MKFKYLALSFGAICMSLTSCTNSCPPLVCEDGEDVIDEIKPVEYEDKDKQEPVYNGEDVLVTRVNTTEFGDTYIEYNGEPLLYNGIQIRTDAFMNTDKWTVEDLEVLFKTAKECGFNMVQVPLEWADIEIAKDVYDFYYLFKVLEYARKYDLKVELLWFGTNMCGDTHSYTVPDYILKDGKTYPKFDAPRTGEFWSYYGLMWYLDFDDPDLLEREGLALEKCMDFIYEYDSTHGTPKSVVGVQIHNEPDIFARWRIVTADKEVKNPETGEMFTKEDAFATVLPALDYLGKVVKNHKYKVITRVNIATLTKGDGDGESSGIYKGDGSITTIRDFAKDIYNLEGIDIVGDDCYDALLNDVKGIQLMLKDQLEGNYAHIAENDGNYANTPSLMLTSAVTKSGYIVYELATSPFFKANNASDIDQGIYEVNDDKTLTPKDHQKNITNMLSALNACKNPLILSKLGNTLGFNLSTTNPEITIEQTINSENVSVNFKTNTGALGYVVDYNDALYAYFLGNAELTISNATISNISVGSFSENEFTASESLEASNHLNAEANKLYKLDYTNVEGTLESTALENIGG